MTVPDARFVWTDFGWWRMPNGGRRLLSWNAATHELKLWGVDRHQEDLVLAVVDTEEEVTRRLAGWAEHNETKEGLTWLAVQLERCR